MAGLPVREDIPVKEVADRWLGGCSINDLAAEYSTVPSLIQRRIARARKEYPGLPWAERKPAQQQGPTVGYRLMNDGVPGGDNASNGSLISRRKR